MGCDYIQMAELASSYRLDLAMAELASYRVDLALAELVASKVELVASEAELVASRANLAGTNYKRHHKAQTIYHRKPTLFLINTSLHGNKQPNA
nr:hypothetical protein CFP56_37663 [Quercus suber]